MITKGVDKEVQTDLTLSLTMDRVTWTPSADSVAEAEVEGGDAKIELAVKAQ